jgi:glutamate-1-semialdehyde 2,1-aminomutase
MSGLFFNPEPPSNYREWRNSDYNFYDTMAQELHELGILCEPDSREPWFLCEAHDMECVEETLDKFEKAVDITMNKPPEERGKVKTSYAQ